MTKIITGFRQILPLRDLPLKGPLKDAQADSELIENGAVAVSDAGRIEALGKSKDLLRAYPKAEVEEVSESCVLLPGFVDCHTHTCFEGSRALDFADRNAGVSYLDIARRGGGIWSSVQKTREASEERLAALVWQRAEDFLKQGITTLEIKSGYGLNPEQELKMLRAVKKAAAQSRCDFVPTCLAAHIKPKDFEGSEKDYLSEILTDLLPILKKEELARRVDIFIEKTAFGLEESLWFLKEARALGFELSVHADQFTHGGSAVAVEAGALSADHLEASGEAEIQILAKSNTTAVVLPGASMGLGEPFGPARRLLDEGACVAIASDYNPGSAPMGKLLLQASVLACYEKLSTAEVLAGLTFRAAQALGLADRGRLRPGFQADFQAYTCEDYREILYRQGSLQPYRVWKKGEVLSF